MGLGGGGKEEERMEEQEPGGLRDSFRFLDSPSFLPARPHLRASISSSRFPHFSPASSLSCRRLPL
eukprot:2733062-Pyramimonas_sp.AAC.1